ncbi:hypothetical protein EJB05_04523 [Eragrostis curvula]|uniref:Uncharacterized protein n=1 Tax=Eragrostis curvula TaxID=38414 RepID=A0A5J9WAQ2_9POAL|nr:hypothetical protein EJB05_04523 [Eragrostis curvula]
MPAGGCWDAPILSPTSAASSTTWQSRLQRQQPWSVADPNYDDDEIIQDGHNLFDEMPARWRAEDEITSEQMTNGPTEEILATRVP